MAAFHPLVILVAVALFILQRAKISAQNVRIGADAATITIVNTQGPVYHIEADQRIPNNLLYSDGNSLKSGDTTIVGSAVTAGYEEGIGDDARFCRITSFVQLNISAVLAVDSCNHCIRLVDRTTNETSRFAGRCTKYGSTSGTDLATFTDPYALINNVKSPNHLLVTDSNNNALRSIDKVTKLVLTIVQDVDQLTKPTGLVQEHTSGDLYITTEYSVVRYNFNTKIITQIAGQDIAGWRDGPFSEAKFNKMYDIVFLSHDKLVIAGGVNNRLRILNLSTNKTRPSICSGEAGHDDSTVTTCKLFTPQGLLVLNSTLYIGQAQRIRAIQGHQRSELSTMNPIETFRQAEVKGSTAKIILSDNSTFSFSQSSSNISGTPEITPRPGSSLSDGSRPLNTIEIIAVCAAVVLSVIIASITVLLVMCIKRKTGSTKNTERAAVVDHITSQHDLSFVNVNEGMNHDYEYIDGSFNHPSSDTHLSTITESVSSWSGHNETAGPPQSDESTVYNGQYLQPTISNEDLCENDLSSTSSHTMGDDFHDNIKSLESPVINGYVSMRYPPSGIYLRPISPLEHDHDNPSSQ